MAQARKKHKVSPFLSEIKDFSFEGISEAQLIVYNADEFMQDEQFDENKLKPFDLPKSVHWVNLHNIKDLGLIEKVGSHFHLETMTLDKIIDLTQRPKMEEFEDYMYMSLKTLWVNNEDDIETEQISFVLGRGFLLSFQEKDADLFDEVRKRLRSNKGIVRSKRSGYLLYLLLDSIVDNYIQAIDFLDDQIEKVSKDVIQDKQDDALIEIEGLKTELITVKRNLAPLRDVVTSLHNGDSGILLSDTVRFIGGIKDQIISILEEVESHRQILEGLTNIHLTNLNNRMNEVMKVLTVISSFFIPLTFLAGIYGMNFEYMPELGWKYSYFTLLGVMVIVPIGMVMYFRSRKWF